MDIVIRVRRIDFFALVSVILHALVFSIPVQKAAPPITNAPGPMSVVINSPEAPVTAEIVPPPQPQPTARPAPTVIARRAPTAREPPTVPKAPQETPTPEPVPTPPVDMLAMIEARRAQRRAAESAAARGPPSAENREMSKEEAASASLNRNLQTLAGREGVGGVFQVIRIGPRTGEFAFNGWRPDSQRKWREVIEVDAGTGGNVELTMVKRMIELIRTHYSGDFNWESYRLQRVIILSARKEDQEGLEDFLMREFFGPQVLNPRNGH
jgi:hypothetical protein